MVDRPSRPRSAEQIPRLPPIRPRSSRRSDSPIRLHCEDSHASGASVCATRGLTSTRAGADRRRATAVDDDSRPSMILGYCVSQGGCVARRPSGMKSSN